MCTAPDSAFPARPPSPYMYSPARSTLTFRRNPGSDLRHRLERPRPHRRGPHRAHPHHPGPRNEGRAAIGVCEQAGSGRRCVHGQHTRLTYENLTRTNAHQPCDRRKSQTSCSSTRSQRTTSGRSSPAAPPRARASSRAWRGSATTSRSRKAASKKPYRPPTIPRPLRYPYPSAVYDRMRAHTRGPSAYTRFSSI